MKSLKILVAAALVSLPLASASAAGKDLLATASENTRLSTLMKAIEVAGLSDKLKGDGPFTLFAPSDEAFSKLAPEAMSELLLPENKEELAELLKAHIVPGRLTTAELAGQTKSLDTVAQTDINVVAQGVITAGNAKVVTTDMIASNGVIHIVDQVIEPVM